ncbi:calcium/sodium antiporter [candidate division KSB1 bacterium]|nr:calcium/sodium antiporter [candidate division KSB1 bacterium]
MIVFWIAIFIVSLIVLVKASGYFTDAAEKIGVALGMPEFIVGVTITSIGTSMPELISSIFAVLEDSSEIVIGNVLGSNITNIFLILGVAAIVGRKLSISYELIHVDLPLLVGSAFLLSAMLYNGTFTIYEALLCIAGFLIYVAYVITRSGRHSKEDKRKQSRSKVSRLSWKTWAMLFVSVVMVYFGAKYTIESVVKISEFLAIGKDIIAASAIALGTSFPELMVSVTAAKKGKQEIAIGNILGSNIFNSFAVMGIPGLIGSFNVTGGMLTFSLPLLLIGALLVATLLYFFITQDKEITRWEGWMLIIFYLFFLGKLFALF